MSILQECSPGPEQYWKYGAITFSISSSGLLPSYKPKGPCPLEIQHTRFLDNKTTPKEVVGNRRSDSCVVVTDQEGEGDPCSINTGHDLATMVRAKILRYVGPQITNHGQMRRFYWVQTLVDVYILVLKTPRMVRLSSCATLQPRSYSVPSLRYLSLCC